MSHPSSANPSRVTFLDNLRYLAVLCVILTHATNGYNGITWMPVVDPNVSFSAKCISVFFTTSLMPLLFLAAGYFTLPSIRKRSTGSFLSGKLKRLGIPWLVSILTVCPVMSLIYQATRKGLAEAGSFWSIWREFMESGLSFHVGVIPSMDQLVENNGYLQHQMWFLSMLIALYFIFAGLYAWKKDWFQPDQSELIAVRQGPWPTIKFLVTVALSTAVPCMIAVALYRFFVPQVLELEPHFSLGPFIQFQPTRLFFYLVYFGLGILAYRNNWFGRGRLPGHLGTWLAAFTVLGVAFYASFYLLDNAPRHLKPAAATAFYLSLNFFCIATVGLSMALAMRWWNRPRPIDQELTKHSYNIYIVHYVFVFALQAALLRYPGLASVWKYWMIAIVSTVVSYVISRFLLAPHPRITSAITFGLLIAMFLVF